MTFAITYSLIYIYFLFPWNTSFIPQYRSNVVVDKVTMGQIFLHVWMFPCPHFFHQCSKPIHSSLTPYSNSNWRHLYNTNYSKHFYEYLSVVWPWIFLTKTSEIPTWCNMVILLMYSYLDMFRVHTPIIRSIRCWVAAYGFLHRVFGWVVVLKAVA